MKQVITILGLCCCISFISAQDIDLATLPPVVLDEFTLRYPDAKNTTWTNTNDLYRVAFKNDKMATMALLGPDGTLLQTETQITITALPEPALDYMEQICGEKKIEYAMIIEDKKGVITFEAIADKLDYTFDHKGQFLGTNEVVLGSKSRED